MKAGLLKAKWMTVVWPAFLVAAALEVLVFAFVDPSDLHWFGRSLVGSRQGIYTVAFFVFWLLSVVGGSLTALLCLSADEVNE